MAIFKKQATDMDQAEKKKFVRTRFFWNRISVVGLYFCVAVMLTVAAYYRFEHMAIWGRILLMISVWVYVVYYVRTSIRDYQALCARLDEVERVEELNSFGDYD